MIRCKMLRNLTLLLYPGEDLLKKIGQEGIDGNSKKHVNDSHCMIYGSLQLVHW